MEPILLILESWWWVAPAAAGAGAVTYAGLTRSSRRARRLEIDAARHEEAQAYHALIAARAATRAAQAHVLSARAQSGGAIMDPATATARRQLQAAKRAQKSASMAVRASRSRVKATIAQRYAASSTDPLPLEKLFAAHDAVTARWMSYETDVTKAIAFPQLSDPSNPATLAFLRAQREAQRLRPASARERTSPQQFLDYRAAVAAMEAAFTEAERQAGAAARPAPSRPAIWPTSSLPAIWPIPSRRNEEPPPQG